MTRSETRSPFFPGLMLAFLMTAALVLSGCGMLAPEPSENLRQPEKVMTVDGFTAARNDSGNLVIDAKGTVRSGGWHKPALRVVSRENGVLKLELVGIPPKGIRTTALANVTARLVIRSGIDELTRIRIDAEMNGLEQQGPF